MSHIHDTITYMQENSGMGFDELSRNLKIDKEEVKEIWNKHIGTFKHLPRTIVRTELFEKNEKTYYRTVDDVIVYFTQFLPFVVPAGTESDLGSIPSFLRWVVDKDDPKFVIAFIAHDILYKTKFITHRQLCDELLEYIALLRGASWWKRKLVGIGLALGGFWGWRMSSTAQERCDLRMRVLKASTLYWQERHSDIINTPERE